MKLSILLLAFVAPGLAQTVNYATQQFFIPMPESELYTSTFKSINSADTSGQVNTMISLTVSIDGTIILYDHWEDGYEAAFSKTQSSTQIWGDGNSTNGCAPGTVSCTNANDVLKAGRAIIIEDRMVVPRSASTVKYDGGDRVLSTKPIAITRGAFPDSPGSLMAGALEVMDTFSWGTAFEAPVGGSAADIPTGAFKYVALYVMAAQAGTDVFVNGSKVATLGMGQNKIISSVIQGWKVTSSKPVQVALITGDIGSTYELRWYTLFPTADWSNSYVSPVGDTVGATRCVFYNPNSASITVTYQTLTYTKSVSVASKKSVLSDVIPDFSGAFFDSPSNFIVLSVTDTVNTGQIFDWGFPVMPRSKLSSQVLIGLGFGCTNNNCMGGTERSVVWVTPTENADLHIDFDNDGVVDKVVKANKLSSQRLTDTYKKDFDMSGAIIFATQQNSGATGTPVPIAAAWGQNPAFSFSGDDQALDLGTVVLPYNPLRVTEHCTVLVDANSDGKASAGDKVEITLKVMNLGQVNLPKGYWSIGTPDTSQLTYIPGSTKCKNIDTGANFNIADNGSALPALNSQDTINRRGGQHDFSFQGTIKAGAVLPEGYCDVLTVNEVPVVVNAVVPTAAPTKAPTSKPTRSPTRKPSARPTFKPSARPTFKPSSKPTFKPSSRPTTKPSRSPTRKPSARPTTKPTRKPSARPTFKPSNKPTSKPSVRPTPKPQSAPTRKPTFKPTAKPSVKPSAKPTAKPSAKPTAKPSQSPTKKPTFAPTFPVKTLSVDECPVPPREKKVLRFNV